MANDPKKFRIPKDFTLFGHKYVVVLEENLFTKENCYGTADEDAKKIRIQKQGMCDLTHEGVKGAPAKTISIEITDEVIIETFYHELCHIILDALGEEKLSHNERFVNMMGKSFLEIYLSANYEEEKKE